MNRYQKETRAEFLKVLSEVNVEEIVVTRKFRAQLELAETLRPYTCHVGRSMYSFAVIFCEDIKVFALDSESEQEVLRIIAEKYAEENRVPEFQMKFYAGEDDHEHLTYTKSAFAELCQNEHLTHIFTTQMFLEAVDGTELLPGKQVKKQISFEPYACAIMILEYDDAPQENHVLALNPHSARYAHDFVEKIWGPPAAYIDAKRETQA